MNNITPIQKNLNSLKKLAYVNLGIWTVAMLTLPFLIPKYPGVKGFFVIFASGISVGISLITAINKR